MVSAAAGSTASQANEKPYAPPICPHILGWPDDVKQWAHGAPWIKALDITSCGIAKERGARVFYRPFDHASGPDGDPKIGGEKFGQEILERLSHLPKKMWPEAVSFQNEFNDVSPETARCFIDMYDTLRKGGYEGLIVFGSYGPGGPTDMTEWARPHIKEACLKADAIETHEYWDLTVKHSNTWLAHRHVRAMDAYPWLKTKPWFIGEFGSDGVNKGEDPQKRSGWRDRDKLTAEEYIKQIEIYRHGDPEDGVAAPAENVLAVFLYQQGAPPHMWQGWETRGTPLMGYMKSTWRPTHGFITGTVTNQAGKPLEGVEVSIDPTGKKATTQANGVYWLFALRPGRYTVSAQAAAGAGSTRIAIRPGDILTSDIKLRSEGPGDRREKARKDME
jgi:hypothetical protein